MVTEIERPTKAKGIVHKMIADTAKGCALAHYETLARGSNAFYRKYKDPQAFVRREWPKYIHAARQILTGMLGNPNYDQEKKDLIFEALRLDGAVNPKAMAEPAKPVFTFKR
jgi:hypothetical protein